jgi:hypothetical protein
MAQTMAIRLNIVLPPLVILLANAGQKATPTATLH